MLNLLANSLRFLHLLLDVSAHGRRQGCSDAARRRACGGLWHTEGGC
jgi:hypothetical protein